MNSSHTEFSFYAARVPSCDAWGLVDYNEIQLVDGSGLSNPFLGVDRGQAVVGVTFLNPTVFRSGYYGLMMMPELMNDTYDPEIVPNSVNFSLVIEPRSSFVDLTYSDEQADNDPSAWVVGSSAGVFYQLWSPVADGLLVPGAAVNTRVHLSLFSFSGDGRTGAANGGVTGGTYDLIPGGAGFGNSGATYHSAIGVSNSKRSATAYGTIVIPQLKGCGDDIAAYLENAYNVKGVSVSSSGIFDITFSKSLSSDKYCVFATGEYETDIATIYAQSAGGLPDQDVTQVQEPSLFLVRGGRTGQLKTTNRFRLESWRKIVNQTNISDAGWTHSGYIPNRGFTERIHFMVFGGGVYGQP